MNVDHIYQLQRDNAFASQFSAAKYSTFIAMPFSNRGGYPEPRIRSLLLNRVHVRANQLLKASPGHRKFAALHRIDGGSAGATVITDDIASGILGSHFFLGDLTGANYGVVLETGIALALKPNSRVLLFTQDDTASLHFDLRVTHVNIYQEDDLVEKAAHALISAAQAFEKEADQYIRLLSSQLTPDGLKLLNYYGRMWKGWRRGQPAPSLFVEKVAGNVPDFSEATGRVAFHEAVRELSSRRLLWTDYRPNAEPNVDYYGIHATKLGWRLIAHVWQHDPQMREPAGAPTGPNL